MVSLILKVVIVLMLLLGFAGFTVSADVGGSNGSKYACITFKE